MSSRYYSTYSINLQPPITAFNPNFVSGLIEEEGGSFVVTVSKRAYYSLGWAVQARLQMKLQPPGVDIDRDLLLSVQDFFGGIG